MLSIHGRMNSSSSSSRIVVREQPIMCGKQILVLLPSETHHNTQLLHSISSFDALQLPHCSWQSLTGGGKIKFSYPLVGILPQYPFLNISRLKMTQAQLSLQRVLLCVYMLYQRTHKKTAKHSNTHTHTCVTLKKKSSDYIGNNFICPYQIRTEIYTFRRKR